MVSARLLDIFCILWYTHFMGSIWSPEEVRILKETYTNRGEASKVALLIGRSPQAVRAKASKLGIKVNDCKRRLRNVKGIKYWYRWEDGKCLFEHREVASKKFGKELTSEDIVHHIDGNTLNNDPSNLVITTRSEHMGEYHLDKCLEKLERINSSR